jgi:hypothetical protein
LRLLGREARLCWWGGSLEGDECSLMWQKVVIGDFVKHVKDFYTAEVPVKKFG